jgi:hypothetical protein
MNLPTNYTPYISEGPELILKSYNYSYTMSNIKSTLPTLIS